MTISVVTDLTATPPKNTITVGSGAGTVMSSVSLWRNDQSGKVLVRTQPAPGFASQAVVDYECPYGVANSYYWSATYSGIGSTLFDETWASTAAWTRSATWTVSGGKVTGSGNGTCYRIFAHAKYRFTISSFTSTVNNLGYLLIKGGPASTQFLSLSADPTTHLLSGKYGFPGTAFTTAIDGTQPFTIDMGSTSITITGTGGSTTVPLTQVDAALFSLGSGSGGTVVVGEVNVQAYSSTLTISETSSPVTVTPLDGWLIHPIVPSLSCKMDLTGHKAMTIRNMGDIANRSNANIHAILGSDTPIATTTGPRYSDELTAVLAVTTAAEESAAKAMLADQTPILVNMPPAAGVGFDYGFYQVGDTSRSRLGQLPNFPFKNYILPLTKVQSPVAGVVNTGWSWASLALAFPTWDMVKAAYATWADVAANNRRPGF